MRFWTVKVFPGREAAVRRLILEALRASHLEGEIEGVVLPSARRRLLIEFDHPTRPGKTLAPRGKPYLRKLRPGFLFIATRDDLAGDAERVITETRGVGAIHADQGHLVPVPPWLAGHLERGTWPGLGAKSRPGSQRKAHRGRKSGR